MNAQFDLARLRALANKLLLILLWAHAPLIGVAAFLLGHDWLPATFAALFCAGVAQVFVQNRPLSAATRAVTAVALVVSISLLVGVFDGQKLQVDLHMYYFAGLAVLVAACDWRAIAAAAIVVALHHLVLNFLLPSLIYSGGSDFARFLLHAVVLILEASALMWIAFNLERMFISLTEETQRAEEALRGAHASEAAKAVISRAAEAERDAHELRREAAEDMRRSVVASIGAGLGKLADGDLTARLINEFPPEYAKLKADFNHAASRLSDAMIHVVSKARAMDAGSGEMVRTAHELASRTEQQAASVEETAAALDEITSTVKRAAEGARQAEDMVASARLGAQESGDVVRQAIDAMSEIETSARQIDQISGVIDEIAFQTNLLALNAGVEAARAGDAGRGFAVVAAEVRSLAQRSAEAARQIKALVQTSSRQINTGVALVGQTGGALAKIVHQVSQISTRVTEITASSKDQSMSLLGVNTAVNAIDQTTQQNAALAEEATAASHGLAQEALELTQLIAQFKIDGAADRLKAA